MRAVHTNLRGISELKNPDGIGPDNVQLIPRRMGSLRNRITLYLLLTVMVRHFPWRSDL